MTIAASAPAPVVDPARELEALAEDNARLYAESEAARARAVASEAETATLYRLVDAVNRAESLDALFAPALDAVAGALRVERASVLLADDAGVMRFRAWRGLSERYRRAVDGHSPWPPDARDPAPVLVEDVRADPALAGYGSLFDDEGIRALAFIPLVHRQRLLGKFMVYDAAPRRLTAHEVRLAQAIADHVAQGVARQRALDEADRERARAEAASRAKDEFLAAVSHELRTPLTSILGWARMLAAGAVPEERRARALETIDRNARAQVQLIEDLLDFSRIVAGKLRVAIGPVELAAVVEQAVESVRPAAEARGVTLAPSIDRAAGTVAGDPDRLQQVVWNLLSNAVKFTGANGRVEISLRREGAHAVVTVADDGEGIDPAFLPFVFERFRQADAGAARAHGGLGLGLAIARHLVEHHGGELRAESSGRGQGATFTVRLPLAAADVVAADPAGAAPTFARAPALDGVRVLVVDDEPDARDLLAAVLAEGRAAVRVAASAAEALAELDRAPVDVLVSDIGMPGETGYDLIRRVRARGGGRLPAVALTAYARAEDRERALDAGFDEHAAKPVDPAGLLDVVARAARMGPPAPRAG